MSDIDINVWIYDIARYIDTFFPLSMPAATVAYYAGTTNIHTADRIAKWIDLRPLLELLRRAPGIKIKFKTLFSHDDLVDALNSTVHHMKNACFPTTSLIATLRPYTICIRFPRSHKTLPPGVQAQLCIVFTQPVRRLWMTCRRLVQWSRGAPDVYLIAMHDSLMQELVNDLETLHLGYLFGAFEFSCTVEIDGIVRMCGEMG
jgi:hypothetical protein